MLAWMPDACSLASYDLPASKLIITAFRWLLSSQGIHFPSYSDTTIINHLIKAESSELYALQSFSISRREPKYRFTDRTHHVFDTKRRC